MSIYNLDKLFHPKTVSIIGASERPHSVGTALMRNLKDSEFGGVIYPVNRRYDALWGHKCYESISHIDEPVDLAVIATPIESVPGIIDQCVRVGVSGAIIISAMGKQVDDVGRSAEKQIREAIAGSALRILGPNCLGIICSRCKLNITFAHQMPLPGKLAFVSQSRSVATSILDYADIRDIGFSYFIGLGSMLDVDVGDVVDYLGGDPQVGSIIMYVERLGQIRKFMSAARAVSRIKPIIVLKSGRTEAGARASISRTGAVAHDDALYNLAFQRAGIVRVKTFEELFDCADLLAKQPRPQKTGLIILSNAGGPAVMAVDALSDYDVEPTALGAETIAQLTKVMPLSWSRANPVDILGDATPERYLAAIDILLSSPETSGLLIMLAPMAFIDPAAVARVLVERLANQPIPILPVWLGGKAAEDGREIFKQAGFPTFNNPERAVRAFMDLYYHGRSIELLQQIPAKLPRRLEYDQSTARALVSEHLNRDNPWMPEPEAKQLLTAYGIPANPSYCVADIDQGLWIARKLGYPLTLSMDPSHSATMLATEKVMNISGDNQLRQAFARLEGKAKGIGHKYTVGMLSIQQMPTGSECELILSILKDRNFGPVISFGMGGLLGEIMPHRALALPPLNRLLARRLLEQTHFESIISDAITCSLAKFIELEEILIRLGKLASDFAEIAEAEISPLVIIGEAFMVLNVKIRLQRTDTPAPLHLVISPYPNQYEDILDFPEVGNVQLRPIRPEDAPLLQALFDTLSEKSIYFRFFSPMKQLPQNMLARFTQIDYDREVALVAIKETYDGEQMLGVVRTIQTFDPKLAEFAILVGDQWQGRGIGTALMRRCFNIAKDQGIETIWSSVLAENTQMLALGRKLGFHIERIPDCGEYEMRLELSRLSGE